MIFIAFMVLVAFVALGCGISLTVTLRDRRIKTLEAEVSKYFEVAHARGEALVAAHKALRAVANGAGNPQLEAQIALDNYNIKEIL